MSSHSPSSSLQNKTRLSTALEQSPHRQLRNVGRHLYLQIDEDYDCTLCNEAENLDIVLCCVYIFLWLIHFIINIKPSQGTRERRSGKASDWSSSAWWLCVWADMTWQECFSIIYWRARPLCAYCERAAPYQWRFLASIPCICNKFSSCYCYHTAICRHSSTSDVARHREF